ncbi:Uncharacterized protein APZ42_028477 [Daphnia magna]|uniref:Uncharacterized protein n=1 Tax=Daphnia magna TaxID=35525 RepID=A0A164QGX9_9CRUS|nr:Uncharacterized protein APZ42_028477 [Daphnia magna]
MIEFWFHQWPPCHSAQTILFTFSFMFNKTNLPFLCSQHTRTATCLPIRIHTHTHTPPKTEEDNLFSLNTHTKR